jgi:hypothetical protein
VRPASPPKKPVQAGKPKPQLSCTLCLQMCYTPENVTNTTTTPTPTAVTATRSCCCHSGIVVMSKSRPRSARHGARSSVHPWPCSTSSADCIARSNTRCNTSSAGCIATTDTFLRQQVHITGQKANAATIKQQQRSPHTGNPSSLQTSSNNSSTALTRKTNKHIKPSNSRWWARQTNSRASRAALHQQ